MSPDNSTPPSKQATSPPVQAESETILELEAAHKPIGTQESSRPEPPPAQFLFEMEGSIPGVPDQQKHKAEPPKEKVNTAPNPGKLQRTFTDTLRQAGPYYYTPPSPVADVKEEVEIVNDVGSKGVKSKSSEIAPETSVAGMSTEAGVIHASDAEQKESADLSNSAGNTETVPGTDKIPDDRESGPYSYTTTQTKDFSPNPDRIPDDRISRSYSYTPTQTNDFKPKPDKKMLFADVWWFTHIDVPDFRICGYCFEKHIRYTNFSSSFAGRLESKDLKLRCSFGAPRVLEQLWPQAVRTKDLSPVKEYMERRVRIPDCRGVTGVTGKDASGVRWFKMRNNDVPEFLICEACLEEQALGRTFETQFMPYLEQQGQNQTWSCDMALAYLRRGFSQAVKMADWSVFSRAAARRLALPQCEGVKGVKAGSRQWYSPAKPIDGVVICEACYDDFLAFSEFEQEFVERPVQIVGFNNLWSCDLSAIGVKNAVDVIRMNHDFTPMRTVLGTLAVTPPCAAGPISSTTWYSLASNSENFDICPTCYTGLFAILGLSHLCRPTTSAQPSERVCDFSNHSPRFMQYITRWIAAVNSPTALPDLLNYISHFAAQPPCAGSASAQNRQWYLLNGAAADLVACTDCHAAAIATTPLAHLLTPTAARDPLPRVCDMYSANMRMRWQQLCADPSAASLDAFVAYSRHRHRVYAETVPRCRELVALARVRAEQHSLATTMSSHYSFMNGITAPSSRITYGAAPLYTYSYGGYETPYGAQAAAAGAAGVNLLMEQMGDTQKVAMLEARWKEVE
ncbi:hypothetical protein SLS56_005273 [Neofusicoccum ribis]|uniref:Integral membrane protein n=1 Tax=Neofusicoccum ribis TaxID=45134 RepID=A0ABR3STZ5_9PEZI